jgi:ribonucleoside-diphosphate reductase alpha chain
MLCAWSKTGADCGPPGLLPDNNPTTVARQRLRNRREYVLEHTGIQYTARAGRFDDGRARTAKTAVDVNTRDAAVAASLLLQHGCPLDTLRRALTRNSDGVASGPLAPAPDLLAER